MRTRDSTILQTSCTLLALVLASSSVGVVSGEPYLVKDINPGPLGSELDFGVGAMSDRILFTAIYGPLERALWVTDGTEDGTHPVSGFGPFVGDGFQVGQVGQVGQRLFFTSGDDLWVTDLTAERTQLLLVDPKPDEDASIQQLKAIGHYLFFRVPGPFGDTWVSDGIPEGTMPLRMRFGQPQWWLPHFQQIVAVGDRFFLHVRDPVYGTQLWLSDLTRENTLVIEINPGYADSPLLLTPIGDRVYFAARDPVHGPELWVSDGTKEGTRAIDAVPGPGGLDPSAITAVGKQVFFVSCERDSGGDCRRDLWVSDGTAEGTRLVCATVQTPLIASGARLFFVSSGGDLWSTDGTPERTRVLSTVGQLSLFGDVLAAGERLFWQGGGLWASDGTPEGTGKTSEQVPVSRRCGQLDQVAGDGGGACDAIGWPPLWTPLDNGLCFVSVDSAHGEELWRSDGTPGGTRIVQDILVGPRGALSCINSCEPRPPLVALASGALFFVADNGVHGRELWSWQPAAPVGLVTFHRGDPNANGINDISDAITIFGYVFLGDAAPGCLESADAQNDGAINISDGIFLLNWLFSGGPEPASPGPSSSPCGFDTDPAGTQADLGCEAYNVCQ